MMMKNNLMRYFLLGGLILVVNWGFGQERKFHNYSEIGVLSYGPYPDDVGLSLRHAAGFTWQKRYFAGVNIGADRYIANDNYKFWALPLTVQGRYTLSPDRKVSLIGSFDVGYGFSFLNKVNMTQNEKTKYEGGFVFNPQVGMRVRLKSEKAVTLALGYKKQQFTVQRFWKRSIGEVGSDDGDGLEGYDSSLVDKLSLHRVSVMVGFGF